MPKTTGVFAPVFGFVTAGCELVASVSDSVVLFALLTSKDGLRGLLLRTNGCCGGSEFNRLDIVRGNLIVVAFELRIGPNAVSPFALLSWEAGFDCSL